MRVECDFFQETDPIVCPKIKRKEEYEDSKKRRKYLKSCTKECDWIRQSGLLKADMLREKLRLQLTLWNERNSLDSLRKREEEER